MTITRNLYRQGTTNSPLPYTPSTGTGEIDLREGFDNLIFGTAGQIAHGRKYLLRRMRRDDDGNLIRCDCNDSLTYEPDTERSCPYCLGEGFYWDEDYITGRDMYLGSDDGFSRRVRRFQPGGVRVDYRVFFFRYDTEISYKDKIIDLKLDTEGVPVVPYIRESIYRPQTIQRKRSDNGRIEYIAVYCNEEDAIRIDD